MYKQSKFLKKYTLAFERFRPAAKSLSPVYQTGIRNWETDEFFSYSVVLGTFRVIFFIAKVARNCVRQAGLFILLATVSAFAQSTSLEVLPRADRFRPVSRQLVDSLDRYKFSPDGDTLFKLEVSEPMYFKAVLDKDTTHLYLPGYRYNQWITAKTPTRNAYNRPDWITELNPSRYMYSLDLKTGDTLAIIDQIDSKKSIYRQEYIDAFDQEYKRLLRYQERRYDALERRYKDLLHASDHLYSTARQGLAATKKLIEALHTPAPNKAKQSQPRQK
ncbi:hypothetical protein FAES_3225 [Fibrella aestuarina BUZ 2]|uniref:Uncharacterized protein n=1 Tax=Fibrella aestuarina BUZ 2 TaxID=1166018 RepID=I0KAT1_9BACT|nr:hypothetical protein [Fibrella aestuarina]CCH01234.1 hypothetical protein FAES_3225 [Fibrella aestuarina BUZ 2]